ncbi:MAG: hypothetical protein RR980_00820 [Mucinivorans sp.]
MINKSHTKKTAHRRTKPQPRKQKVGGFLSGGILQDEKFVRRLPILAFGGVCMLAYMAIGFGVQKRYNHLEHLTDEIAQLRTVSITTAAVRGEVTRQENVERLLVERGILLGNNIVAPTLIVRSRATNHQ